ncbi:hypothetical protein HDU77_005070 [Chytriomyces hyalinus]|nr:hypothetical protein HDU77_005070 [Chytriomyces hyalinus]
MTSRLALIQLAVTASKEANLVNARAKVIEAAEKGAGIVVLPECFNSPYGTSFFPKYAEPLENGPSSIALSNMARDAKVYLIGGSFPEIGPNSKFFNTCTIWGPNGDRLGVHRKVHLFDIDIPGKQTFKESSVLSAGSEITTFDSPIGKIGVGICYDIRFPEMAMIAARKGCIAMIYPGAFNMTTGPLHWELLQRARAIDNQMIGEVDAVFNAGVVGVVAEQSLGLALGNEDGLYTQSLVVEPREEEDDDESDGAE